MCCESTQALWFAQNSLPLRWQRQLSRESRMNDKVVICSKFITFAVANTTIPCFCFSLMCCDLLKIHYLCGDKYNTNIITINVRRLWFAQNSLPLRWQIQPLLRTPWERISCDLLKIHYLCGDKYNVSQTMRVIQSVVICSKFITFAVTNTTMPSISDNSFLLWFAQNSLPLRWQIQH